MRFLGLKRAQKEVSQVLLKIRACKFSDFLCLKLHWYKDLKLTQITFLKNCFGKVFGLKGTENGSKWGFSSLTKYLCMELSIIDNIYTTNFVLFIIFYFVFDVYIVWFLRSNETWHCERFSLLSRYELLFTGTLFVLF